MTAPVAPRLQCVPLKVPGALTGVCGARVARSPFSAKYRTLSVLGSRIEGIRMPLFEESPRSLHEKVEIDLSGLLVLPGLINAHDHLGFSLFPQLGTRPYGNWREWAQDIYHPEK